MIGSGVRRLIVAVLVGAAATGVVAGALLLWGFGVRLDVAVAAGAVAGAVTWFFHFVFVPPAEVADPEPIERSANASGADRRTRVLESQLRGAQRGLATTVTTLHETIAALARDRAGDGPYPPVLSAYLLSAPRPLSRAQLRTILRELTTL